MVHGRTASHIHNLAVRVESFCAICIKRLIHCLIVLNAAQEVVLGLLSRRLGIVGICAAHLDLDILFDDLGVRADRFEEHETHPRFFRDAVRDLLAPSLGRVCRVEDADIASLFQPRNQLIQALVCECIARPDSFNIRRIKERCRVLKRTRPTQLPDVKHTHLVLAPAEIPHELVAQVALATCWKADHGHDDLFAVIRFVALLAQIAGYRHGSRDLFLGRLFQDRCVDGWIAH